MPERRLLLEIAGACETTQTQALAPLVDIIRARYGDALQAVVYYGSCLRSGNPTDGLVDFYVVVDSYRRAHAHRLAAAANAMLPPNVYYLEATSQTHEPSRQLRCKYALISMADLQHAAEQGLQSSIWGRFAQPVAIVHAQSAASFDDIRAVCGQSVVTLLSRALPMIASPATAADAFTEALALSYGGELRVESSQRSQSLVDSDAAEYARRLRAALALLPFPGGHLPDGRVAWQCSTTQRRHAARRWQATRAAGRAGSVLRLAKASFTFEGAIDYGAYKLERHTGVKIDVTPALRRHPVLHGLPLLWRLYRQGVLR